MTNVVQPDTDRRPVAATSTRAERIVLAKVGLDGHDRGIKVIARGLRDAGFHVIYGGIWQSPAAVAQAVADEDAQWLGISLLNGAHLTLVPKVLDELERRGLREVRVVLGGIIPEADVATLRELGVAACFGPGTSIPEIAATLKAPPRAAENLDVLVKRCRKRDRNALSRLLSRVAEGDDVEAIRSALPKTPGAESGLKSRTVAFTGSAGVGKSSLIARLTAELRTQKQTVAIVSCDPQSPITGGALLGDRVRMAGCLPDDGVLIRSLAVPSGTQGVAPNLDLMIEALRQFGFDLVLVETVGTGQGDVAVRGLADVVVVLVQPESGDSVQWEKAGLMEVADVIVINKSDLPGAERLESELREHLTLSAGRQPELVRVSASRNEGVPHLWQAIDARRG